MKVRKIIWYAMFLHIIVGFLVKNTVFHRIYNMDSSKKKYMAKNNIIEREGESLESVFPQVTHTK